MLCCWGGGFFWVVLLRLTLPPSVIHSFSDENSNPAQLFAVRPPAPNEKGQRGEGKKKRLLSPLVSAFSGASVWLHPNGCVVYLVLLIFSLHSNLCLLASLRIRRPRSNLVFPTAPDSCSISRNLLHNIIRAHRRSGQNKWHRAIRNSQGHKLRLKHHGKEEEGGGCDACVCMYHNYKFPVRMKKETPRM